MAQKLEVALAAGGTAGHINPALALAEELADRGHHVRFFGQPNRLEAKLVPEAGFELVTVHVTGFDRTRPWTGVTALVNASRAERAIGKVFASSPTPDVAMGFGAYVEVPLIRWCAKHDVPCMLHEQNSVPGLANKLMARHASAVCVAVPAAREAFVGRVGEGGQVICTGNPVRRAVTSATREGGREAFGIPADAELLVVFGGSLGARHVNQAVCACKDELLSRANLHVIHSTGAELFDEVCEALALTEDEAARWHMMPYIQNMGDALAAADVVVSRAGASSIAEIAALEVPSLLVPYPLATGDHQTTNARSLVDAGAAVLVPDDQLDGDVFPRELTALLDSSSKRDAMREAARGMGQAKAAATLADQVESVAGRAQ